MHEEIVEQSWQEDRNRQTVASPDKQILLLRIHSTHICATVVTHLLFSIVSSTGGSHSSDMSGGGWDTIFAAKHVWQAQQEYNTLLPSRKATLTCVTHKKSTLVLHGCQNVEDRFIIKNLKHDDVIQLQPKLMN